MKVLKLSKYPDGFSGDGFSDGGFSSSSSFGSGSSTVQHFLQLLNKEYAKLKNKAFIEYGDVPNSNYEKHLRENSIIDDENIQLKVA
ncbi:6423_t:CDS:2 [Funneliformis caledonium]|uniref:6423_t:CDS:1 n=1 Tax=Funneliformis caledonium TaxID=1117310 RepID=A0A9N9CGP0_9GLOM|nr:6423_t:CDS:2 [Funneliformis caledonium]